jgi:hypothetical protein
MPNNGRSREANRVAIRRKSVAHHYASGRTIHELAGMHQCSVSTICNDLAKIRERWMKQAVREIGPMISEELERLRLAQIESFDAWERSKLDAETERITMFEDRHALAQEPHPETPQPEVAGPAGVTPAQLQVDRPDTAASPPPVMRTAKIVKTKTRQVGNPRFLELFVKCVLQRCELMGVVPEAIVKLRIQTDENANGSGQRQYSYEELRRLPPDELVRIHRETLRLSPNDS